MCNAMFNYNNEEPPLEPTEGVSPEIQLEHTLPYPELVKRPYMKQLWAVGGWLLSLGL